VLHSEIKQTVIVKTGIAMQFPNNYVAQIWDRSSLGSRGIHRLAGVIDSSYRGEIMVVLINLSRIMAKGGIVVLILASLK